MNTVIDPGLVIRECHRRGLTVTIFEGRLKVRGPRDAMDAGFADFLNTNAPVLVRHLAGLSPQIESVSPCRVHEKSTDGLSENTLHSSVKQTLSPLSPEKSTQYPSRAYSFSSEGEAYDADEGEFISVCRGEIRHENDGLNGLRQTQFVDIVDFRSSPEGQNPWTRHGLEPGFHGLNPDHDPYLTEHSIIIPAAGWRWIVATWRPIRWRTWHDRAIALIPQNATAETIVACQYRAFLDLASTYELNHVDHDSTRLLSSFDPTTDPQDLAEAEAIRADYASTL